MKRVKMMLMSLALLAVVGAALAFKAKFSTRYCTADLVSGACPSAMKCPNLIAQKTLTDEGTTIFCTVPAIQVQGQWTCFTNDDPARTLDCIGTTTLKGDN